MCVFALYNISAYSVYDSSTTSVVMSSTPPSCFASQFALPEELVSTKTNDSCTPRRRRKNWTCKEITVRFDIRKLAFGAWCYKIMVHNILLFIAYPQITRRC